MSGNLGVVIEEPFPYQQLCLDDINAARGRDQTKFLGVMATGLGKTVLAAFDIKWLFEHRGRGRVLYVCHDTRILAQARKVFEAVMGPSYSYGFFHGTEKNLQDIDFLFGSFQTMENWREAFRPDEFRYIVYDEFHHGHAATYRPTIEYFEAESILGLTATPERGDGLDITTLLGPPVFELGLFKALGLRYLCDVDYRIMTDELTRLEVLDTPAGKLSIAELNRTIFVPKRDEEIARIIMEKMTEVENPRVIIFCTSITHAENMADLMPHAVVLHSKLKNKVKNDRLAGFRAGTYNTIITVDMLNEGIDVPEANIIVFLRSTSSRTIFLQQLGRGLRKALGKLKVLVLDFVANCERFEMIDQLQQGVRSERERLPRDPDDESTGNDRPEPLTITLDGVTFDERAWALFNKIREVREGYTVDILTAQLLTKAGPSKVMPTVEEVDADPDMASRLAFTNAFDATWNEIAARVGLKVNQQKGYSKAKLTAQLLAKAKKGVMPGRREVDADPAMASSGTFMNVFGTNWSGIARELGLKPKVRTDYTRAELTAQLLTKAGSSKVMPTGPEVRADPDMATVETFTNAFGATWRGIARELGLKVNQQKGYSKAELAAQLLAKAENGVMPTSRAVKADPDMATPDTFRAVFGATWDAIAEELGLKPSQRRR